MNGNAEKKCEGILVSHPSVSGKVYASAAFWTLNHDQSREHGMRSHVISA